MAFANSKSAFDLWTFVHYLYGVHFFAVGRLNWRATLVFALLWEVFENSKYGIDAWRWAGDNDYAGDTIINSVSDVTFTLIGWRVAQASAKFLIK